MRGVYRDVVVHDEIMKSILRKILFVKSYLYRYPYSSMNLASDLERIYKAGYLNRKTILRGKEISTDQFSLWEKWNFSRGYYSFDALGFFSGKTFIERNMNFIIGTVYPNPIIVIAYYFSTFLFAFILTNRIARDQFVEGFGEVFIIGILNILLLTSILYFRKRIMKSVESELEIQKTHHNKT